MGTFTINNKGIKPSANRDVITTGNGIPTIISVLDNDLGYNLPLLIIDVTTPDQGGTVTIINGGTELEYTSDVNYSQGDENFSYTLTDSEGLTSTALVTVTVVPNT